MSLIGGCEEDVELFDKMHEQISNFETPSSDEIHTLEEFADAFHEFIHRQFREITLIAGVHNVEQAIDA